MEARLTIFCRATVLFAVACLVSAPVYAAVDPRAVEPHAVEPHAVDRAIADAKSTMLADPAVALSKAALARVQTRQLPPSPARAVAAATADWLQAEALVRLGKASQAMPIADRALRVENAIAPQSKLHADTLLTKGGIYDRLNDVVTALANYQAAFRIYAKLGDQRGQDDCVAEHCRPVS